MKGDKCGSYGPEETPWAWAGLDAFWWIVLNAWAGLHAYRGLGFLCFILFFFPEILVFQDMLLRSTGQRVILLFTFIYHIYFISVSVACFKLLHISPT